MESKDYIIGILGVVAVGLLGYIFLVSSGYTGDIQTSSWEESAQFKGVNKSTVIFDTDYKWKATIKCEFPRVTDKEVFDEIRVTLDGGKVRHVTSCNKEVTLYTSSAVGEHWIDVEPLYKKFYGLNATKWTVTIQEYQPD